MKKVTDKQNSQSDKQQAVEKTLTSGYLGARRTGVIIAFLVFGVFGVWAATAPIDGASHASGTVVVRSNKKLVQHLEGGIISDILVENGNVVRIGDPIVLLDTTQSAAQLQIVKVQLAAQLALEARLRAERDSADSVEFPPEMHAGDADMLVEMESQTLIFNARKIAHEGRKQMLEQRIMQLRSRLNGLRAQRDSQQDLMQSYAAELEEVRALLADGFSDSNRLRQVERSHSSLRGEVAQLEAEIASTEMLITETGMEIIQHEREFQSEVVTQLGETQSRLKDLREQRRALEDVVVRKVVRAPDNGVVNGLEVHTIGGVIAAGQAIAEIVPEDDELIIESRVSPLDIDRVAVGQTASVRFSSFSAQTTPSLTGHVILVAADASYDDSTGQSYYMTRIAVEPDEMEKLGNVQLVPGMPVDVFISSGARTLLQYLFKPLSSAVARSFIED